jgi:phosphoserine phosphatase
MSAHAKFAAVVVDVDSTLCGVEGIDWLAALRGPELSAEVTALTQRAMDGDLALDAVYGTRLRMIRPTRHEIAALAEAYCAALAPGAPAAIAELRANGVIVQVVSSGIKQAIEPVVTSIGLDVSDLHAVEIHFGGEGVYLGYDTASDLTRANGKAALVESLKLPHPVLAVGDGATDLAMRLVTDRFAAFTGFVRRESIVRDADIVIGSFEKLRDVVLG